MSAYRDHDHGELMSYLLSLRDRFESQEEFQAFVVSEIRRFITELRSMDIELTMRPNFSGQPVSHNSPTRKLSRR